MADKIILYDMESRRGCASLNTWKTRLILNYKNISYETKWVPLQHVNATIEALGVPPNATGTAISSFTVPTITLPDNQTHIMNSILIAPKLEELHPSPSLYLQSDSHIEAQAILDRIIQPLVPYWLPRIFNHVLTEDDGTWFQEVRAKEWKLPLEEWKAMDPEVFWEAAKPGLEQLGETLGREAGAWILGKEVSYGDFVVLGALKMFEVIDPKDLERMFKEGGESVRRFWEASVKAGWLDRADH